MKKQKTPPELDRIADVVLNYRPKATTPKAKKRKRKANAHSKDNSRRTARR